MKTNTNTPIETITHKLTWLCLSLGFWLLTPAVQATNLYWDPNGASAATSGTWNTTSTQWATSSALTASTVVWNSADSAYFAAGTTPISALTITVNSPITCAGMGVPSSGAGAQVTNVTFVGTGSINLPSGMQTFQCGGTAGNFNIDVPVTGTGGIGQHGNGYIALETNNTYSGGTLLTGGQLVYYYTNASFGTGPITNSGSSGALVNNTSPAQALTIPNNVVFSGAFTLNLANGIAVAGAPGTTWSGNWLLAAGNNTLYTGNNAAFLGKISGVISGPTGANLIIADPGALILAGPNTYPGTTTLGGLSVPGPVVQVAVAENPGVSGPFGVNTAAGCILFSNATLQYSSANQYDYSSRFSPSSTNYSIDVNGQNVTFASVISGNGALTNLSTSAGGSLSLTAANTYKGGTVLNSGTLIVNAIADSGASAIGPTNGGVTLGGGTLNYTNTTPVTTTRQFNGTSGKTSTINSTGNLTISGRMTGSAAFTVVYNGPGTLTLANSADNSFLGMTVNAKVILNTASTSGVHGLGNPTTVNNNGYLLLSGSGGFDIYGGVPLTVNSGGTFDSGGQSDTFTSLSLSGTGIGGGALTNSGAGTSTLTLTAANGITVAGAASIGGNGNLVLNSSISGANALTLLGPGNVTLNTSNSPSFTGGLNINGGEFVGVAGGGLGNCAVTLNSATHGVLVNNNTAGWTNAGLTVTSASAVLDFNFGYSVIPSTTVAALNVNGAATFTATPAVTVEAGNLPVGTYPLMTWASTSGTPPSVVTLPPHVAGNLSVVGNTLYLTVTANTQPLRWTGNAGNGVWDIAISQNWDDNTATATTYQQTTIPGDAVVLDDTYVTSPATITLNSTVTPASVTANNSLYNYTITGTGGIAGGIGLTKAGTATLTLGTVNTYTGPTTISGGTLSIGADNNLGTAPSAATVGSIVLSNSVLSANNNVTISANRGITMQTNSTLDAGAGLQMRYSGIIAGPLCNLIKTGPGMLVLANNANSYSGCTIISNGIVQTGGDHNTLGTPSNLGDVPSTYVATNIILAGGTLQGNNANFSFNTNRGITLMANSGLSSSNACITGFPQPIVGGYSLTISNGSNGVVVLQGTNTYTGATIVTTGLLSLQVNGSISNSSGLSLGYGAGFDVSLLKITNFGMFGTSFSASGSGTITNAGTANASVLNGTNNGSISLGSLPIYLTFTPTSFSGDSTHPSLYVTAGTLILNGNSFTVNNAAGTPLGVGTYTLIKQNGGSISASGSFPVTVTGSGLAAGCLASISVTGTTANLIVFVPTAAFSGLTASQSITYGTPNIALSGTVSGTGPTYPAMGETVTVTINGVTQNTTISDSTGDFSLSYTTATLPYSATPYAITYGYAGDSSLLGATNATTALTVNQASLVVTAATQTKTYGQTLAFGPGSTQFTSSPLQNSETIGSVTLAVTGNGGAANAPVSGSPYMITPSAATGGTFNPNNYSITYNTGLLTVGPASLTVTALNTNRFYGATNPVFQAAYSGFVNGEAIGTSDVEGSPALTCGADTNSPVGEYVITNAIGTLTSTNYSFVLVNGELTVTNEPLTFTADSFTDVYGTAVPTLTYSVSGFVNGDSLASDTNVFSGAPALSTAATNGSGVLGSPYPITITNGTLALVNTNYVFVFSNGSLSVTPATVSGTITASDKTYDGTTNATISSYSLTGVLFSDDVTLTGGTASFSDKNAGLNKTVTAVGLTLTGTTVPNYELASTTLTAMANINQANLTVSATGVNKIYDGTTAATVTLSDNRIAGDSLTDNYAAANFSDRNVGVGKAVTVTGISVTGSDAGNYAYNTTAGTTASISVLPITVTAAANTKNYDGTTSATTAPTVTVGSIATGDTAGFIETYDTPAPGSGKTLTPSGSVVDGNGGSNYNVSFVASANGVINQATLTVTANSTNRLYGATNPVFTVSYSGFVNGETLATSDVTGSPSLSTSADTNSPVGDYVITNLIGSLSSTDYSFSLVNGTLVISNAFSTNVLAASSNPALPGADVTFTATVSALAPSAAVPYGVVQFLVGGNPLGAPVTLTNGQASADTSSLPHGYNSIQAVFAGSTNADGSTNIAASTSAPLSELINTAPVAGTATFGRQADLALTIPISSLLAYATDADGDTLTLVAVDALSTNGAAISTNATSVLYQPAAVNPNVADSFHFTVSDAFGATNTGVVDITILPNSSPVDITGTTVLANGAVQLSFSGVPGFTYLIQFTSSLTPPITWTTVSTNTAAGDGSFSFTDTNAVNYSSGFYRTATP